MIAEEFYRLAEEYNIGVSIGYEKKNNQNHWEAHLWFKDYSSIGIRAIGNFVGDDEILALVKQLEDRLKEEREKTNDNTQG